MWLWSDIWWLSLENAPLISDRQRDRKTIRQTNIETERQRDIQTNKQIETQLQNHRPRTGYASNDIRYANGVRVNPHTSVARGTAGNCSTLHNYTVQVIIVPVVYIE